VGLKIGNAAARLCQEHDFEEINLARMAEEVSITRPDLCRYSHTREGILLELLNRDIIQ